MSNRIVLSLGGSLLCPPDGPNPVVIKRYAKWLRKISQQRHIVVFTGGGELAREYINIAKGVRQAVSRAELDWIGIQASRLNAELLRTACGNAADPIIITYPRTTQKSKKRIRIGCGWKPGRSTDDVAVRFAIAQRIPVVYNLSNITHIYDRDPKKYRNAKKLSHLTWSQFFLIIGHRFQPGIHAPFDPVAARLAERHGITIHIMHGKNLANVERAIRGKPFVGTTLSTRLA